MGDLADIVSRERFNCIVRGIDKSNFWGYRDYAVHILLYGFGLRPTEIVNLNVSTLRKDTSNKSADLLAMSGLTDHVIFYLGERPIPVERQFANAFEDYRTYLLVNNCVSPCSPLIRNKSSMSASPALCGTIVRQYSECLSGYLTPGILRKNYLANLKEKGVTPDSLCPEPVKKKPVPLLRCKYLPEHLRKLVDKYKAHNKR